MLVIEDNKVVLRGNPPVIGSKHQSDNAIHRVDGIYWERYPYVDDKLQAALLNKKFK